MASPGEVRNSNWIEQALKQLFHFVLVCVPSGCLSKRSLFFFSCFLKAAPRDEQDPHTAVIAGKKAN